MRSCKRTKCRGGGLARRRSLAIAFRFLEIPGAGKVGGRSGAKAWFQHYAVGAAEYGDSVYGYWEDLDTWHSTAQHIVLVPQAV